MNTNQFISFFSNSFKIIKKSIQIIHAFLCTIAQGAMTWFSLEHFFHPLHIKNHYVRDSFQVMRGILAGATTITTALTRGTEIIYPNESIISTHNTSLKKRICGQVSYWGIGWSASWFIFLTFFTIIYSILPEEDEPTFAFEEAFSLLVAISVRHGFMVEIVNRLKHSILSFDKNVILQEVKNHPIKFPITIMITGVFSFAQSYRIYSLTNESLRLISNVLISNNFLSLGFLGKLFIKNMETLCCISANTIGFSTFMAYLPEVYEHMAKNKNHVMTLQEKVALSVIYLDAIIVAIENALVMADFSLNQSDEEYSEFLSYLAILTEFIASFYAARCFSSSAEKNVVKLFKREQPQLIHHELDEKSPLLIIN